MNFKEPVRSAKIKKLDNRLHIEIVKINNGAHDYCMKEDTRIEGPFEFGIKPVSRNNKTDWEDVKIKAIEGKLKEIPADIYVKHYRNLVQIAKDNMVPTDKTSKPRGIWLYGESGAGKSLGARMKFPGSYPKLCNKWWDGYKAHKTVIMDDIGLEHKCLG